MTERRSNPYEIIDQIEAARSHISPEQIIDLCKELRKYETT